jgi:hypothetical protein
MRDVVGGSVLKSHFFGKGGNLSSLLRNVGSGDIFGRLFDILKELWTFCMAWAP